MVPPAVHPFHGMKISSVHFPPLIDSKLLLSSSLFSHKSPVSPRLASILADHDYVCRQEAAGLPGDHMILDCGHSASPPGSGDEKAAVNEALCLECPAGNVDTDFLKDLDDLDFDLSNLDPCHDVEMVDSWQDFIDAALEDESSRQFVDHNLDGAVKRKSSQADVIDGVNKEEFLALLCLRSAQVKDSASEPWSSPLTISPLPSRSDSVSGLDNMGSLLAGGRDERSMDTVPTKRCSCLSIQSVSKSVYSTATASRHDTVRTCPSTLVTHSNGSHCSNCVHIRLVSTRVLSPLFIDTSPGDYSQALPRNFDGVHTTAGVNELSGSRSDTVDVTSWLTDSQSCDTDTNTVFSRSENVVSVLTADSLPHVSSLDLESFEDLEDYLNDDLLQPKTTTTCSCGHSTGQPRICCLCGRLTGHPANCCSCRHSTGQPEHTCSCGHSTSQPEHPYTCGHSIGQTSYTFSCGHPPGQPVHAYSCGHSTGQPAHNFPCGHFTGQPEHTCSCGHPSGQPEHERSSPNPKLFSFIEERRDHKHNYGCQWKPDCQVYQRFARDNMTPESSSASPCSSPAWSATDPAKLSPLGTVTLSVSPSSRSVPQHFSLKGQLALLKLFSEENVESLLLADSSVPAARFM